MAITTTTLLALYRLIAKELGYAAGDATAGSTSRITDTSGDSPFMTSDDSELFKNAWAMIEGKNGLDAVGSRTASRARTSNVATIITADVHGLSSSDKINISGVSGASYDAQAVTVTVASTVQFTYPNTGSDEATTADTGGLVTSALPQCEIRRIASYTPASQLVDTDATNLFGVAVASGHKYGIYMGIPPERLGMLKGIKEYLNETLRETYYRTLDIATEAQDVGMETGGTATDNGWTASSATLTYAITLATGVQIGSRALKVVTSGAGGYAQQSFNVRGSESWDVAVDLIGTAGGDIASLVITSDGSSPSTTTIAAAASELKTARLFATHTVPSDATALYVRLQGTANGDVSYWDNLSVRRSQQTEVALPSWVQDPSWIEDVEMWIPGSTSTTGIGNTDDTRRARFMWWRPIEDYTGITPFKLMFHPKPRNDAHIVFKAVRPHAELTRLAATTTCNKDLLRARVLAAIYTDLADEKKMARWGAVAQSLARSYDAMASKSQVLQMKEPF